MCVRVCIQVFVCLWKYTHLCVWTCIYVCVYVYISVTKAKWFEYSPKWPGSHTKSSKIVLDASLLNTQNYKVRIKGKLRNLRKWVVLSPTPRCNSCWKKSLRVTLDYGRSTYLWKYTYIFTQPLRSGRIWHKINFLITAKIKRRKKNRLTGLNSEFSFS